jgi:hypothetical protein
MKHREAPQLRYIVLTPKEENLREVMLDAMRQKGEENFAAEDSLERGTVEKIMDTKGEIREIVVGKKRAKCSS